MTDETDNVVNLPKKTGRPAGPGRGHKGEKKTGSGMPASGLPAMGASIFGPSSGRPAGPGPGRPRADDVHRQRAIADKRAAAEMATAELYAIGMNQDEGAGIRTGALNAFLNRVEGLPVQRVAGTPGGETVEEMRALDPRKLTDDQRQALRTVISASKEHG